jgi:hypothetical protein
MWRLPQVNIFIARVVIPKFQTFLGNAKKGPYFGTRLSPKRLVMRATSDPIITPPESGFQEMAAMKAPVADAAGRDASPSGAACDTDAPIKVLRSARSGCRLRVHGTNE